MTPTAELLQTVTERVWGSEKGMVSARCLGGRVRALTCTINLGGVTVILLRVLMHSIGPDRRKQRSRGREHNTLLD